MKKTKNRNSYILLAILIIYFFFTSGFVFEVTKSNATDKIETPYSIAMSAERTGVVGLYTDSDIDCAEWFSNNTETEFIVTDRNARTLLIGYVHEVPQLRTSMYSPAYSFDYLPDKPYYFLLTDWNTRHNKYVEYVGIGLRKQFDIPDLNGKLIYSNSNSEIYYVN
jgi:uncharacterized membrane protein